MFIFKLLFPLVSALGIVLIISKKDKYNTRDNS